MEGDECLEVQGITRPQSDRQDASRDYMFMAQEHQRLQKFLPTLNLETGAKEYQLDIICMLCRKRKCRTVFFSCGHLCVCDKCIRKNNIGPFSQCKSNNKGISPWHACPVCMKEIHYVASVQTCDADPQTQFDEWVNAPSLQQAVSLSHTFQRQFQRAAKHLERYESGPNDKHLEVCTGVNQQDKEPIPSSGKNPEQKATSNTCCVV